MYLPMLNSTYAISWPKDLGIWLRHLFVDIMFLWSYGPVARHDLVYEPLTPLTEYYQQT